MIATKIEMPSGFAKMKFSEKELTDVLTVGARGVTNYLKKFYREKSQNEQNKLGGKRTFFWDRKIGGSVQAPKPAGVGKIKGGTIRPVRANTKYLTIPINKEAYGRKARQFPDLFVIKSKKGNLLLVKPDKPSGSVPRQKFNAKKEAKRQQPKAERSRRENKPLGLKVPERETPTMEVESGFTPYFLLKKSVTQKPWPNSIPTEKQITDVFNEGVEFGATRVGELRKA